MKRTMIILAIIMGLIPHTLAIASVTRHYDVKSGLSESTVRSIVQDSRGYIWIGTQDGLNRFNGNEFTTYRCSYLATEGKTQALNVMSMVMHPNGRDIVIASKNAIEYLNPQTQEFRRLDIPYGIEPVCITFDKSGLLWIGCENGLFTFNERTGAADNPYPFHVNALMCDSSGRLWIGTDSGLLRRNAITDTYETIHLDDAGCSENIASITEDSAGDIWIGFWHGGLARLDKKNGACHIISPDIASESLKSGRIRFLREVGDGTYLLCSNLGLFEYNSRQGAIKNIKLGQGNASDNIYTCQVDHEGGLWIGTYFNGLFYISPDNGIFECYHPDNISAHFRGTAVSAFCEDCDGKIWIGTENGGLNLFDPDTKEFLPLPVDNPAENIHALFNDGKYLYIGTFAQGLKRINLSSKITETYLSQRSGLPNDHIFCLKQCSGTDLYIGTMRGCAIYNIASGHITDIPHLADNFIYSITEDKQGNIWFADYHNGLHRLDASGTWHDYRHIDGDTGSIPGNKLTNVSFDGTTVWICTEGDGICSYDYIADSFTQFNPDDTNFGIAYGLVGDPTGRLWISTNHGIFSCEGNGNIRHYTSKDNLQSEQFNYGGVFRSADGRIYLGGVDGFNILNPLETEKKYPAPYVSASVSFLDQDGTVRSYAGESDSRNYIRIPRRAVDITLNCECMSYIAPQFTTFLYSIDNRDFEKRTMGNTINFADFPYGRHTVKVKAINGIGEPSANTVTLYINNLPPLPLTTTAKILYLVLLMAIIYLIIHLVDNRRKEKIEYEAYQAKINFFTQIAHEIKTPVTLIKGPLELIRRQDHDAKETEHLNTISKNTDRLLTLINQLLDFKKINNDGYRIHKSAVNPADIINKVVERFDIEGSDQLKIDNNIEPGIPICMLDGEAYTKIASNLMSNAFKHAKTRIDIELSVKMQSGREVLHLAIRDDGRGISEEDASMIFETFYQSSKEDSRRMGGVGLGLPLVRLLAEKHGGKVWWNREWHGGCEMCVDIPVDRYIAPHIGTSSNREKKIRVLVVEDIPDMLDFICEALGDGYNTEKAPNGKVALDMMKKSYYDAVVSDIAMPVMDGFELLKAVRNDPALRQTAFILLTAETSREAKITGLENGSDAYIEKPFSIDQLQATIDNLVRHRNAEPVVRNDFIAKVTDTIKQKVGENDISVDEIASEMNMSRSSFQRRIKSLTGLSAGEFIRGIRLQQAAELLASGQYRVNEVCDRLGFNKPSYFAACFKKQYGMLPKDYISSTSGYGHGRPEGE